MSWRIFYEDGTSYGNDDGAPADAPACGVIAIGQVDDRGQEVIIGAYPRECDWYWWRDDRWWGGKLDGLLDAVMNCAATHAKAGRITDNDTYSRIAAEAAEWRDRHG